jgi:serine/threonine protein kinase
MQARKPAGAPKKAPRSARRSLRQARKPSLPASARRSLAVWTDRAVTALPGLEPGARFGEDARFEVEAPLGSGGSSFVLLVRDARLGRRCAAKFLLPLDADLPEEIHERAKLEAHALSALQHENIVRIYDTGSFHGHPFLLMEYCEGETLEQTLQGGPLPLDRTLELASSVLDGLEHAHAHGILHLDLKPGNLWLPRTGGVKILDFGIGALKSDTERLDPELLAGTPAYMAPEQWRGLSPDVRTDIWSFGALLHETLCGELPYDYGDIFFLRQTVLAFQGPTPLSTRLGAPPSLDALLERALAPEPNDRFQSVAELRAAVEDLLIEEAGNRRALFARMLNALARRRGLRPRHPRSL